MFFYGDFIVFLDVCDKEIVIIIVREVFDGIIVLGYIDEVFEILKGKCKGNYNIVKIDENYIFEFIEIKDVYGIIFE